MSGLSIFAGNSNPQLGDRISEYLAKPLGKLKVNRFSDGEIQVEIHENVRKQEIYVIQSTCNPVNDHLVELLLLIDAFKRSSASRITAVIPYFGYARQDKKVAPRVPISAKMVADLLENTGVDRVITMDLHAGQIQGFFSVPVDNLYAAPIIIDDIRPDILKIWWWCLRTQAVWNGPGPMPSGFIAPWRSWTNAGARPIRQRPWRLSVMSRTKLPLSLMIWWTRPAR